MQEKGEWQGTPTTKQACAYAVFLVGEEHLLAPGGFKNLTAAGWWEKAL